MVYNLGDEVSLTSSEMDESENSHGLEPNFEPSKSNEDITRRLIRLIVGIVLVGQDALRQTLPLWEAEAAQLIDEMNRAKASQPATMTEDANSQVDDGAIVPETSWFPQEWEYRLVGLAFESPRYLRNGFNQLVITPRKLWRFSAPLRLPLEISGVTDLLRSLADSWLERMQVDMEHWEEVGRSEAQYSRKLGQVALRDGLERFLERLAENPEVQDLVQSQTSGLTTEFVEEIRERTVSADSLIDGLVRRFFKKQPELPGKLDLSHSPKKVRYYE